MAKSFTLKNAISPALLSKEQSRSSLFLLLSYQFHLGTFRVKPCLQRVAFQPQHVHPHQLFLGGDALGMMRLHNLLLSVVLAFQFLQFRVHALHILLCLFQTHILIEHEARCRTSMALG